MMQFLANHIKALNSFSVNFSGKILLAILKTSYSVYVCFVFELDIKPTVKIIKSFLFFYSFKY